MVRNRGEVYTSVPQSALKKMSDHGGSTLQTPISDETAFCIWWGRLDKEILFSYVLEKRQKNDITVIKETAGVTATKFKTLCGRPESPHEASQQIGSTTSIWFSTAWAQSWYVYPREFESCSCLQPSGSTNGGPNYPHRHRSKTPRQLWASVRSDTFSWLRSCWYHFNYLNCANSFSRCHFPWALFVLDTASLVLKAYGLWPMKFMIWSTSIVSFENIVVVFSQYWLVYMDITGHPPHTPHRLCNYVCWGRCFENLHYNFPHTIALAMLLSQVGPCIPTRVWKCFFHDF